MAADGATARERGRSFNRTGARTRRDGRVQCQRHGKALYPTQEMAMDALLGVVASGAPADGLNVYSCDAAPGFHIGHWRAPWSVLARKATHDGR